ncbi:Endonuclease/exonuclease/phosphatase [Daedaleopsis nitida]|nr:Endonuclease/exonuclease/phosphatase [Daedaleopsis nitida]
MALRVASLNMNGFGCTIRDHPDNKWGQIYRTMQEARIGILLLQETHLTSERVDFVERMFKGKIKILYSLHPLRPTQKEGVAIVVNCRLVDPKTVGHVEIDAGRALQVSLPWNGGERMSILCIYAPTSDGEAARRNFFEKVKDFYVSNPRTPRPNFMAGDFNNVEDDIDRLPVANGGVDSSIAALDELKITVGLMMADGWRATHPTQRAYTFLRGSGGAAQMSRLDRIYTKLSIFDQCREWRIHEGGVRSDHSMVSVEVTRRDSPVLGKGRPVFPKGLLKDRKLAKLPAQQRDSSEERNPQIVLARLKSHWLRMARDREREVIRAREAAMLVLRKNHQVSDDIRSLYAARARKQKQPTKYWVRVNKDAKPRDRRPDGGPVYEYSTEGMCEIARSHHMNLQEDGSDEVDSAQRDLAIEECTQSLDAGLSLQQSCDMGAKISYGENEIALRFAKNESTPGIDGIPYEVWKTMHARVAFDVLLEHGVGWMCPIYKEKGEKADIVNYRPITLLNTDYKLMTKVLAIRLARDAGCMTILS